MVISSKLLDQLYFVTGVRPRGALGKNNLFYGFQNTFDSHPVSYIVLQCIIFLRLQHRQFLDRLKITHLASFLFPLGFVDRTQETHEFRCKETHIFIFINCWLKFRVPFIMNVGMNQ